MSAKAWLVTVLSGAVGTVVYHWSQFSSGFDLFFGERGESRSTLFWCEHWFQVLQGHASLLAPPIHYPVPATLSEIPWLLGYALPFAGLRSLAVDPFLALQSVVVVGTFLMFLAGFGLLYRGWGLSWPASLAGAGFLAFNSPRLVQSGQLQSQSGLFLLLFCWGLTLWARTPGLTRGRAYLLSVGAGLALVVEGFTSPALAALGVGWLVLWVGLTQLVAASRPWLAERARSSPGPLGALVMLAVLALLPLALGQPTPVTSWRLLGQMPSGNYLWGGSAPSGAMGIGAAATLGWLLLTGWAVGLRASGERLAVALGILATGLLLILALAWGAPGSLMVFLSIPLGVFLAYGLDHLTGPRLRWWCLGLAGLVLVEQFGWAPGFSTGAERIYLKALAARLPPCTAFYAGAAEGDWHGDADRQVDAMLVALVAGKPTLNGFASPLIPGSPNYESEVKAWCEAHSLSDVAGLELAPPVEVFSPDLFVDTHYHDFLRREPTAQERQQWNVRLQTMHPCDRSTASLLFLRSDEFFGRGSLIYRLYWLALGRGPTHDEFLAALSDPDPASLVAGLPEYQARAERRSAQELLESAQSDAARTQLHRQSIFALGYQGYLRRPPDPPALESWNGSAPRPFEQVELVEGILRSSEYWQRFRPAPYKR